MLFLLFLLFMQKSKRNTKKKQKNQVQRPSYLLNCLVRKANFPALSTPSCELAVSESEGRKIPLKIGRSRSGGDQTR